MFHGNHVSKIIGSIQRQRGATDVAEGRECTGLLTDQARPYRTAADVAQPVPRELQGNRRTPAVELGHRRDLTGRSLQRSVTRPLPIGVSLGGQGSCRIGLAQFERRISVQNGKPTSDDPQPTGVRSLQGTAGQPAQTGA